jgi:hypothetical protein
MCLYPYRLEQFVRFAIECVSIPPTRSRRVILVEEDS